MTAAARQTTPIDTTLALLRDDLRTGHACFVSFDGPQGTAWVEILGPKGTRPHGDCLVAPVRTLRLWVPGQSSTPRAVAVATHGFDAGLRAIEEHARPHLHPPEVTLLQAMLCVVRAVAKGRGPRVPGVGDRVTQEGSPSLQAWASCLTLGDLEAALLKSVA